jgi:RNA polymerase sigma factor (sigma-70 family)
MGVGNPANDLYQAYVADIERYPALSREDEARLARAIEVSKQATSRLDSEGEVLSDEDRRQLRVMGREGALANRTLVQSNLRLVVQIAEGYRASGLPILDLVQEGNLGLMHAVEKFDWRKGFRFSTYARWWVRQAIRRGIANSGRTVGPGDSIGGLTSARTGGDQSDETDVISATGTAERTDRARAGPRCTFCGRTEGDQIKLIAGPGVYVCQHCVALGDDVLRTGQRRESDGTPLVPVAAADQETKCSFCGKRRDEVGGLVAGTAVQICIECLDLCEEILDEERGV